MRLLLLPFILLVSCTPACYLSARTENLNSSYLASTQVKTPEACYACFVGQQVLVSWRLPREAALEGSELFFAVRFKDGEVEKLKVPVESRLGYWIYRIINKEYRSHKGILSYSARIVKGNETLYRFDHKLWQDIIPDPPLE